jgi:hypothetical protein
MQIIEFPRDWQLITGGDNKVSNVLKIFMHVGEPYGLLPRDFCWICICDWLMSPFAAVYNIWMPFIVFGLGLTTEVPIEQDGRTST